MLVWTEKRLFIATPVPKKNIFAKFSSSLRTDAHWNRPTALWRRIRPGKLIGLDWGSREGDLHTTNVEINLLNKHFDRILRAVGDSCRRPKWLQQCKNRRGLTTRCLDALSEGLHFIWNTDVANLWFLKVNWSCLLFMEIFWWGKRLKLRPWSIDLTGAAYHNASRTTLIFDKTFVSLFQ